MLQLHSNVIIKIISKALGGDGLFCNKKRSFKVIYQNFLRNMFFINYRELGLRGHSLRGQSLRLKGVVQILALFIFLKKSKNRRHFLFSARMTDLVDKKSP